jgi:hypothetical protein
MIYGLGDGSMVNGVYVMNTPITSDTVSSSGTNVYENSSGEVFFPSSASFTDWLNSNTTLVIGVAVGAVVLLMFAKEGR